MDTETTAQVILTHSALVERGDGSAYVCSVHGMLYTIGLCASGAGWYASAWDGTQLTDISARPSALQVVRELLERGPVQRECLA